MRRISSVLQGFPYGKLQEVVEDDDRQKYCPVLTWTKLLERIQILVRRSLDILVSRLLVRAWMHRKTFLNIETSIRRHAALSNDSSARVKSFLTWFWSGRELGICLRNLSLPHYFAAWKQLVASIEITWRQIAGVLFGTSVLRILFEKVLSFS